MSIKIGYAYPTGANLVVTLEQLSPTAEVYYLSSSNDFSDVGDTPSWADKSFAMTEGVNENKGSYTVEISNPAVFSTSTNHLVRIRIHDDDDPDNATLFVWDRHIVDNALVFLDQSIATRASVSDVLSQISAAIKTDVLLDELTGVPSSTPTLEEAVMLVFMMLRNGAYASDKITRHYNNAGEAFVEQPISEDETTSQVGQMKNIG